MNTKHGLALVEILAVFALILALFLVAVPKFLNADTLADVANAKSDLQTLGAVLHDYHALLGAFPPAGQVNQTGFNPWRNSSTGMDPNSPGNGMHACSILWVAGSFYDNKGDNWPGDSASVPGEAAHYDLRVMTSPVEAITYIPRDPFKNDGGLSSQYDYFGLHVSSEFVLRSLGPDGAADVGCDSRGFNCAGGPVLTLGEGSAERRAFDPLLDLDFGCDGCATLSEALEVGAVAYAPTNGTESTGDLFLTSEQSSGNEPSAVEQWEAYK